MADKSPRKTMSKKSGKSLKQKRADKRAKAERASSTTDILHLQKHWGTTALTDRASIRVRSGRPANRVGDTSRATIW
jgi:hypothetical protein